MLFLYPQLLLPSLLCLLLAARQSSAASHSYIGCFSDSLGLIDYGRNIFQSRGLCLNACDSSHQWVMGLTNATHCLCGSRIPPMASRVDEARCNLRCSGYPQDTCKPGLLSQRASP